ncbi:unnamed protein product [Notodromas monacha]|uniref:Solute carrier family 35 member F5 n=1 Tax=Notodromas monacha TaxID=399045 RepID=A0A7R9BPT9_9CRUS|nr:unnamed protein product [Notodromas monacha]CAG0918362.1 unnamed protein product [Notodromas monacha]
MILTTRQRFVLGIVVLLVVDVIWVASSEATEYLFKGKSQFKKPYFTTYVKTSLFTIYLLFIGACRGFSCGRRENRVPAPPNYRAIDESSGDQLSSENEANQPSLTESAWVPTRYHDGTSDRGSGIDSDSDAWGKNSEARKNVRFSRVSEVRQLCDDRDESAKLARLSYEMSARLEEANQRVVAKLTTKEVFILALKFCLLWFIGQYSYQAALAETEAGVVNVLSSSSALFTLLLAAVFPSSDLDGITVTKTVLVFLNIIGIELPRALVSLSDFALEDGKVAVGVLWALVSALFYSIYLVTLRKEAQHEDALNMPLFFGFVGLINAILLWPGLAALHYLEIEKLEMPSKDQWVILLTNGLIGTVLAELLWLCTRGCFLTSSLTATLGMSLTLPLTVLADKLYRNVDYPTMFFFGAGPTMGSFLALALVQQRGSDWDPVLAFLAFVASIPSRLCCGALALCSWCLRGGRRRRAACGDRLLGEVGDEDFDVDDENGPGGEGRRRFRRSRGQEEKDEKNDERLPIIDATDDDEPRDSGVVA